MNKFFSLVTIFTLLTLTSCGELSGGDSGANKPTGDGQNLVGGLSYRALGENKLLLDGSADNGGDAPHNFEVKVKIPENEQATFFFFASKDLSGGIEVSLKRDNASEVSMTLTIDEASSSIALNNSIGETLYLSLDLHNNEEDAHVIIWDGANSGDGARDCLSKKTCLFNTDFDPFSNPDLDPVWDGGYGGGSGSFWGYKGNKDFIVELKGPRDPLNSH